ncbi:MAG: hypothetical protein ABW352_13990 [Polyangiales bacterium]
MRRDAVRAAVLDAREHAQLVEQRRQLARRLLDAQPTPVDTHVVEDRHAHALELTQHLGLDALARKDHLALAPIPNVNTRAACLKAIALGIGANGKVQSRPSTWFMP